MLITTRTVRLLVALLSLLALTGCLSVGVTIDVSSSDHTDIEFVYQIRGETWRLGVFDDRSPERAIPVSRRDAEETALLHEGLSLLSYEVSDGEDDVRITVRYRAANAEAFAGLWGEVDTDYAVLDRGAQRLYLPIAPRAPQELVTDPEALELVEALFGSRTAQIVLVTADSSEPRFSYAASMAEVLTSREAVSVSWEWAENR